MLEYCYYCDSCSDKKTTQTITSFVCNCGGTYRIERLNGYDPLTPYYSENMGKTPILVESRGHRRQLMKDRKIDIMPYKKNEYEGYRPLDNRGHKMTSLQYEKAQKKGFVIPK